MLSEAGFTGWGGFSGWVGLWMEVVVGIGIWGIFGFRTIERRWGRMRRVNSGNRADCRGVSIEAKPPKPSMVSVFLGEKLESAAPSRVRHTI